jgi:uncharacterized membrane protein
MQLLVVFIIFCLAVHRVTRLIVADTFPPIEWLRAKITGKLEDEHWLVYLFGNRSKTGCPWCMSIYVAGLGVLALGLLTHWFTWPIWVMIWLAASSVTGFLAKYED